MRERIGNYLLRLHAEFKSEARKIKAERRGRAVVASTPKSKSER